jgi:soluble lytic murein transglycosylase-like protein
MDATARGLGVTDSFDPVQSLDGGARFLGGLLKQFNGNESLALAAYNAGPGAVQKYGGIPPYEETQRYVPKVLGLATQYRRIWAP